MPLTYTTLHFARSIILNNPSFALLRPSLRYATAMGLITCYTAHCVRSTGPDISLVSLAPFHVTYASFRSLSLTTFAALRLIRSFHSLSCYRTSLSYWYGLRPKGAIIQPSGLVYDGHAGLI